MPGSRSQELTLHPEMGRAVFNADQQLIIQTPDKVTSAKAESKSRLQGR